MLRWLGLGWYPDVPARDITAAELPELDAEAVAAAIALGLYEEVSHAGT